MTRKEKINQLNDIFAEINEDDNAVCYLTSEDNELIESAIEALEQESCEDAANRQTAIDLVNSNMTFDEFESPTKKTKFHISDMDITFDKPLYQEEMEHLFFDALHSIGVKGHRGCPD